MTKLNHSRPYLKNLDNLKRELSRVPTGLSSASRQRTNRDDGPWPWEAIILPLSPEQDTSLSAEQVEALRALMKGHLNYVFALGGCSPLVGKVTPKKRLAADMAETDLVDEAVRFLRFCASECVGHRSESLVWLQHYVNAHLRNGNGVFECLGHAVFELGLEQYFHSTMESDDDAARAELVDFFGAHLAT